jgi:hypothetical protein
MRVSFAEGYSVIYPGSGVSASQKHVWEDKISKPSLSDTTSLLNYLTKQYARASAKKEILTCRVYAPDTLLTIGQSVIVRKQSSGVQLDTSILGSYHSITNPHFVVTKLDYTFTGTEAEQDGLTYLDIELSRFTPYT